MHTSETITLWNYDAHGICHNVTVEAFYCVNRCDDYFSRKWEIEAHDFNILEVDSDNVEQLMEYIGKYRGSFISDITEALEEAHGIK